MRVTLVAHGVPPAPTSGAQRAGHVIRALREAGAHVRLITPRRPDVELPAGAASVVSEVSVWPTGAELLAWALGSRARLAAALRRGAAGAPAERPVPPPPDPLDPGPALRRWLSATLRFPDGHLGFLPPAVRAVLDPAHPPADVIYTTGPPVTVHLIGLALRALGGGPWVAEYRDPWIVEGEPYRSPALRSPWTDAGERWLAERCLALADEVVAVSEGIAGALAPRRAALGTPPPRLIRNGIPELAARPGLRGPGPERRGPRRVVHLGNLYAFRDPRPFFDGLAALRGEAAPGGGELIVDFVGDPPPPAHAEHARRRGLEEVVRFRGRVEHAEGQAMIREADVLLLLAQRQPLQVPNKLYEYLGSRRPILAFADPEGESARILRRAKAGIVIGPEDPPERIAAALARLLEGPPLPSREAEAALEEWTTDRQMARLPEIVRRAAAGVRES